ncbi:MAG: pyridoxal phosphate-dependent aminotransferase [Phycisphaerales bacterium]|nr:pyridoxal phosphate-dependent aminotransferase [Phycisphaerales bacterium]
MRLSRRVCALKPSSTLAVGAKAAELRAHGVEVLTFATGEPDFDTPRAITEAACASLRAGNTHYSPVPGDKNCREAIAQKLREENGIPEVTSEHVVVSAGGKQSLHHVFHALLDPPVSDEAPPEVVLPVPAWVSYAPQIQLAGGVVVEVVTDASSDFKATPDQIRQAISENTRAIVLNSPSNPCGTMYTPDELRAIAAVIAEAAATTCPDIVIISDEIYEKIILGSDPFLSVGSIPEVADRTITINGLSKAYAMTGWRVGYLAGSGAFGLSIAGAVKKLQGQSTTSIPGFIMDAIPVALRECGDEVERMRQAFVQRGRVMYEAVSQIPGLVCPEPTGAFYVFPDVSAHFGKTSEGGRTVNAAADFATALLEEKHVAVVPGEDFGTGAEKCLRLTFACSEAQIVEGVKRLRAFVEGMR